MLCEKCVLPDIADAPLNGFAFDFIRPQRANTTSERNVAKAQGLSGQHHNQVTV